MGRIRRQRRAVRRVGDACDRDAARVRSPGRPSPATVPGTARAIAAFPPRGDRVVEVG